MIPIDCKITNFSSYLLLRISCFHSKILTSCNWGYIMNGLLYCSTWPIFIYSLLATAEMAEQHPNKVLGVVSQRKLLKNVGQLHFTPGMCGSHDLVWHHVITEGVRLSGVSSDGKGQQYHTPDHVIVSCGSDIIIVGRGIYEVVRL